MNSLPIDIIGYISSFCDDYTLKIWSCTCKYIHDIIGKVLIEHYDEYKSRKNSKLLTVQGVLNYLKENKKLAPSERMVSAIFYLDSKRDRSGILSGVYDGNNLIELTRRDVWKYTTDFYETFLYQEVKPECLQSWIDSGFTFWTNIHPIEDHDHVADFGPPFHLTIPMCDNDSAPYKYRIDSKRGKFQDSTVCPYYIY